MALEMVNLETLAPIAIGTDTEFHKNNSMDFGVKCYEAGMIEVLKGIAEDRLEKLVLISSGFTTKLNAIADEKRLELESTFNARDYALIKEYEEALSQAEAGNAEDYYIQGFLDGYRYLAHRLAYNCEGFNAKRLKKQYSKENE